MDGCWKVLTSGVLLVVAVWAGVGALKGCHGSDSAYRLFQDKMQDYNPLIRPVVNNSDLVDAYIGLALSQLIDIDEKNQIMITSLWLKQRWKDHNLVWNPDDYDGLREIQVPIGQLWSPDIVLYNTADGNYAVSVVNRATVKHDGTVFWSPPGIFRSSCRIDISFFPFDEQRCKMKFGAWTNDGGVMNLNPMSQRVELVNFRPNGEWKIVDSLIEKNAIKYQCCEETYIDVTYTFVLYRNPLFYILTLVLPCVLITILTMLVFFLPSAAQEKITLCISVLIALILFLLIIPSIVPPTSDTVPFIARYMLFTMSIVFLSIIATVWTINVHFRRTGTHVMGSWTRRIFVDVLPRVLLMKRPSAVKERRERARQQQTDSSDAAHAKSHTISSPVVNADAEVGSSAFRMRDLKIFGGTSDVPMILQEIDYQEIGHEDNPRRLEWPKLLESLQYIEDNMRNSDDVEDSEDDWKFVGLVIDRLLLCVFAIVVAVGTTAFFVQAPVPWGASGTHNRTVYEEPDVLLSAGYDDRFPQDVLGSEA